MCVPKTINSVAFLKPRKLFWRRWGRGVAWVRAQFQNIRTFPLK